MCYEAHLSVAGGSKLPPYGQLTRKRYDPERLHNNNDVRPATITAAEDMPMHPGRISGAFFQLEDQLMVHS